MTNPDEHGDCWSIEEVVGHNLKRLRERRGWTQDELGARMGEILGRPWARAIVSQAEYGKRAFAIADLVSLCIAFEVTPDAFLVLPPLAPARVRVGGALQSREQLDPIGAAASPARRGFEVVMRDLALLYDQLEEIVTIADAAQKRGTEIHGGLVALRHVTSLKRLGADRAEDYARLEREENSKQ